MSDMAGDMITFANARLDEALASAATDEQRRYVEAMRGIVLMHEDYAPEYRSALASGDAAWVQRAGRSRQAVLIAVAFIASARSDHPDFRKEWRP
jgi:hypothetical protein